MKKQPPLGLLASGPVSRTGVARLTSVKAHLGPVKAPSYRVASRMVNSWRAGFAVRDYTEFKECPLIIVDVPATELPALLPELVESAGEWSGRTVLLWSAEHDSSVLEEFAVRGAETASFSSVPGFDKRLAAEGSRAAIREVKRLFAKEGWRVMAIAPGRKPLYQAGLTFADPLALPLVQAAVEALTEAGLSYVEAVDVSVAQMQRVLRSYVGTGRRAWPGPPPQESPALDQLEKQRPVLADLYRACLVHGCAVFRKCEINSNHAE